MIKKIYISGAHGMVGRNIQDAFLGSPYELLTPSRAELDLLDGAKTREWLAANKPDLIIHCAGQVGGIAANISDPAGFLLNNLHIGVNLIQASLYCGIKRFLNLASSCMYPANHSEPLKEDMLLSGSLEPTNEGYALAKIIAARLCQYISANCDYGYKSVIPCNLYGRYDKFDPIRAHMIPAIIQKIDKAIRQGQTEVEIWGDGQARREFMYAEDFADFIRIAVEHFSELPAIMNVGVGTDYTVDEYYQLVGKVLGYRGSFVHNLSKPSGMLRKLVDISRQKAMGFTPRHSLEQGIRKTYEWYKSL